MARSTFVPWLCHPLSLSLFSISHYFFLDLSWKSKAKNPSSKSLCLLTRHPFFFENVFPANCINCTSCHQDAILGRKNGVHKCILEVDGFRNLKWKTGRKCNIKGVGLGWSAVLFAWMPLKCWAEGDFVQDLGEESDKLGKHPAQIPCARATLAYLRKRKKVNVTTE